MANFGAFNPFLKMFGRRSPVDDYLQQSAEPSPENPDTGWRSSVVESPDKGYEGRDNMGYLDQIRDAYLKEGPAMSAYRQHVQNLPNPEDYKPSIKRRIGAAIIGGLAGYGTGSLAGFQLAQNINEAPYRKALQEYGMQDQGLEESAKLEQEASLRRIQYAREVRQSVHDENEFAQKMREYDLKVQDQSNKHYLEQRKLEVAGDTEYGRNIRHGQDLEEKSREANLLNTYRGQQIQTTRRGQDIQAATSRRGQDINEGLGYDRNRITEEIGNERNDISRSRANRPTGTNRNPALDAGRAERTALSEVLRENPDWEKFIGADNRYTPGKDRREYQKFVDAVKKRKTEIMNYQYEVPIP